jgi:hypothetical protein
MHASSPDSVQLADRSESGSVDTVVTFTAKDTAHFRPTQKTLRLRGSSTVSFKTQQITAEEIIISFDNSTMKAGGMQDASGRIVGFPILRDNGEEYAGKSMEYNFTSGKGRVEFGETSVEGGYYYGSAIKRIDETTAFIENGCFTTCDAPHPHFYFTSPKMKVVTDDKIFLDPLLWYVDDVPVFALPFGVFFSLERGRRSGLIMPSPLVTSDRGVALQNLGYYFAISDYMDAEITTDITSKGGFTLYGRGQYVVGSNLRGNAELRFGYTRFNVLDPFAMNIGVQAAHSQQLRPGESIIADVLFTTQNLFQNTSFNPLDRLRQNARSNVSYQRTFYNGMTLNTGYTRDQNMLTGSVSQNPSISFGVPQLQPFKGLASPSSWISDIQFSYRATGRYNHSTFRSADTGAYRITESSIIEHRPSITVTPRLGNVQISPSITFSENWYFHRYTQSVNVVDSTLNVTRETGFFREYTYGVGVSASTFLYGMAKPDIFGWKAIRHTLQPSIGLQYVPDQSDPMLGFFGRYVSPVTGQTIQYGRFGPSGQLASQRTQALITGSFLNRVAIKVNQGDTVDKAMDLFTLNASTSYNLAADSLQLSPITFNLRTPALDQFDFNLNGVLSTYDQVRAPDPATGRSSWRTINQSMVAAGKGLARLTSLNVQFGTRFSGGQSSSTVQQNADTARSSLQELEERFDQRINAIGRRHDIFGDNSPGWSDFDMPWDLSTQVLYSLQNPDPDQIVQSLYVSFRGSVSITPTMRMSITGSYDALGREMINPIIDIQKQIHCWYLSLNWIPTGFNRGFFLRFGASAQQLKDFIIPKQSTPLYR